MRCLNTVCIQVMFKGTVRWYGSRSIARNFTASEIITIHMLTKIMAEVVCKTKPSHPRKLK